MNRKKDNKNFFDVSALIDERFGAPGTPSRIEAEKNALALLKQKGDDIKDYDFVLDAKYGAPGSQSRIETEEKAKDFFSEDSNIT